LMGGVRKWVVVRPGVGTPGRFFFPTRL
jgi:hypothetical protein